jgi:cytidine deaminase
MGWSALTHKGCLFCFFGIQNEQKHSLGVVTQIMSLEEPGPPCGPCRQVVYEFNPEMTIQIQGADEKEEGFRLEDLSPHAFVSKQDR